MDFFTEISFSDRICRILDRFQKRRWIFLFLWYAKKTQQGNILRCPVKITGKVIIFRCLLSPETEMAKQNGVEQPQIRASTSTDCRFCEYGTGKLPFYIICRLPQAAGGLISSSCTAACQHKGKKNAVRTKLQAGKRRSSRKQVRGTAAGK